MKYTPVIGLEVHVELKTKSKMFCGCLADYFGKKPNTLTCPVCLGLPGALPVPNKTAIEWCVKIGLALNCEIPPFSKFDRKNYFYPDLPKGYQISQYDRPFCINGNIKLSSGKTIRIRRVHMEEDTAKLIHSGNSSLIDFNRSGVPLVEIVTEPDFERATQVVEYLKKLAQIVRYLDVSNADMEKGDMRLEPNISLSNDDKLSKYKVEVKNINSFRFVDKAISFEIERQTALLKKGQTPTQETRGWDEKTQTTKRQRVKEEANDYRYFPEPDIPPITWPQYQISNIKYQIGELPSEIQEKFEKEYKLSPYDLEILTRDKQVAQFFEEAVKIGQKHEVSPKQIANILINKKIDTDKIMPAQLIKTIVSSGRTIPIDEKRLDKTINNVLKQNQKAVEDYKKGKEQALQFLIGQAMKKMGKKVEIDLIKSAILKRIKSS